MDPNEALKNARIALERVRSSPFNVIDVSIADELADAFEALDGWLTNGGFLPTAWANRHVDPGTLEDV
jgi:hypothetical protein